MSFKKVSQAQIPFEDFSSSMQIGCDSDEVVSSIISLIGTNEVVNVPNEKIFFSTEKVKNESVNDIIEQIVQIDSISAKEVNKWDITYYYPSLFNKKKAITPVTEIKNSELGIAVRYIVNLSKYHEVIHFSLEKYGWEKKIRLPPNRAISVLVPLNNLMPSFFKNVGGESILLHQKGHRPVSIKKDPQNRHILVLDGWATLEFLKNKFLHFAGKFGYDITSILSELEKAFSNKEEKE